MATERIILNPTISLGETAPASDGRVGVGLDAPPAAAPSVGLFALVFGELRRRDLGYATAKRLMDILIAFTLLVLMVPLFIGIAIAIRLESKGPVFYRGERIGRFGNRFTMVKFRSMTTGCDASPHAAFVRSLMRDETTCDVYKVPQDRRVTQVGAFLRRTSLDELPQLWNVLRGDMSLVGPRPDVPYAVEEYADWMHRRLVVKPGITGLWQVSGRSRLSLLEMYRLDVRYATSASLGSDLRILARTPSALFIRNGAA